MRLKLILLCLMKFVVADEDDSKSRFGILANQGDFPFAVCIDGPGRCSGVLVTPDMFITAGHCFKNTAATMNVKDYIVIMGVVDITKKDDPLYQERKISKYKLLSGFTLKPDSSYYNDIGAGYLTKPFVMSTAVGVAKIVTTDIDQFKAAWYQIVKKHEKCKGLGWGRTFKDPPKDNSTIRSKDLKYIWVLPWPDANCSAETEPNQIEMCGKGEVIGESVDPPDDALLVGDSGGPFVCGKFVYGVVNSGNQEKFPIITKFILFFPYITELGIPGPSVPETPILPDPDPSPDNPNPEPNPDNPNPDKPNQASSQILHNTYTIISLSIYLLHV